MKLTKKSIDALKPNGRDAVHWDDDLPGFGLRINPGGKRSFVVQYRNSQGRSRRLTVGAYGKLTPDEARREATRLLRGAELGSDPAEKRQEDRKALTVAQLCDEYLAKAEQGLILGRRGSPKKASTLAVDKGRIARHILPLLGRKLVRDLSSADVKRFVEAVARGETAGEFKTKPRGLARVAGGPTAATRAVGLLGGMLSYAQEAGYREGNPAHGVRKPKDNRREFRLDARGYEALECSLSASEERGEHWQALAAIRLLAVTGCRRGEVAGLRWAEIDVAGRCLRLGEARRALASALSERPR